ncbi:hypothetical protein AQUCO_01900097v1 [Aquilegia coerulea]|uniref:Uncharacterized protein n=1 Tax=Aquilegia coerulea TaxID=218851 RepID=A0A2G5DJ18_AQUCA|nr:hypothetical protein AQUCO_01900097v1 [Aquilegia coerulea]
MGFVKGQCHKPNSDIHGLSTTTVFSYKTCLRKSNNFHCSYCGRDGHLDIFCWDFNQHVKCYSHVPYNYNLVDSYVPSCAFSRPWNSNVYCHRFKRNSTPTKGSQRLRWN